MTVPTNGVATPTVNFVVSHLHPTLGLEKAALELFKSLKSAGVETNVIALGGGSEDQAMLPSISLCGTRQRGMARLNVMRGRRARHFEVPHAPTVLVGVWAAIPYLLFGRGRPRQLVVWEHSLISEKVRANRTLPLLRMAARWLYRRADVVVAVSAPLAKDLSSKMSLRRVVTIPNITGPAAPLSQEVVQRRRDSLERTQLIAIGSLTRTKNQQLILRALPLLPNNYSLTIVGDGPDRKMLRQLAESLGIEDRVTFAGRLEPSGVAHALSEAHIMVHTALGETFGYVYIEAAQAGVPVVSTTSELAEEMIPRYAPGLICDRSPEGLAETITLISEYSDAEIGIEAARQSRESDFAEPEIVSRWRHAFGWTDGSPQRGSMFGG